MCHPVLETRDTKERRSYLNLQGAHSPKGDSMMGTVVEGCEGSKQTHRRDFVNVVTAKQDLK